MPIYDFSTFNHELDLLEIRLYELYDYITLFLNVESNMTFSGKAKPLHLQENWSRFARYHKKMRRIEVNLEPVNKPMDVWNNEQRMRDEGIRLGLLNSANKFLLLTSNADEIPNARSRLEPRFRGTVSL
ncbi:unnamed protein product [Rotaria magnacalcarata]|uniref:Uncharacterized protein n=1 Tax=Rotaria magnacalcarata TaxID=392030 RepID=A0A816CI14_9BILA|nr:unnamed protein product [Rotaria magnacalcarata]CAF4191547.1 unnamed protein product [Rotaria magnacalcarata]CAF4215401.1 unnamed protein product [Rotaria magnacalcarata]CAF4360476.1 unnamed protein product [Rotaria magnacalcarata]